MSKRKKLKFQTKKNAEIAKNKRALLYFCSFLLVFATVSMLILLKAYNFDLSNLFNGRKDEIKTTQSTTNTTQTTLKSANFLLYCFSDDDKKEIRFIAIINADMKNKSFKVCTISPKNRATVKGEILSLSDHFTAGGAEQLKKAVEVFGEIKITRYAGLTDSGFKNAIKNAGRIELTIAKQIKPKFDIPLSLPPGKQVVSANNLLNYIRYSGQLGTVGLETQAKIFCSLLDQDINAYNAKQGEVLFSLLINSISYTDITIVDYPSCQDAIDMLTASKNAPETKVVQSLQGFNSSDTPSVKEETTK
ncbi:MAG: LCP family protein [Eubacteriales bacterium]